VDHIVVFGAGVQALWHTRLILTLRGKEVKSVTYVSSSKGRVDGIVATVSKENRVHCRSGVSCHYINGRSAGDWELFEKC
jgi:hypothetical protein